MSRTTQRSAATGLALIVLAAVAWSAAPATGSTGSDSGAHKGGHHHAAPAAATTTDSAQALVPQSTCPVMGGAINKDLYVDHDGKRIYVCCPGCIPEVKKDPQKYIDKLKGMGQGVETIAPAKALVPQKTCPVMKEPINKKLYVDYDGKRIYVCCGHCKAEVKKEPARWVDTLAAMGEAVETLKK